MRYCIQHEGEIRADACTKNIPDRNGEAFWRSAHKISKNNVTKHFGGAIMVIMK